LPSLAAQPTKPRFIYTGDGWLFGATGDDLATEQTPFHPLPAFAWMVPHLRRVLATPGIDGIVIHPAMVYTPGGGVFHRFAREAVEREAVRVVENEAVRWPLVHSADLATLYARAIELYRCCAGGMFSVARPSKGQRRNGSTCGAGALCVTARLPNKTNASPTIIPA
jgi:nucleoside-diphosphate-sugar epimerase